MRQRNLRVATFPGGIIRSLATVCSRQAVLGPWLLKLLPSGDIGVGVRTIISVGIYSSDIRKGKGR